MSAAMRDLLTRLDNPSAELRAVPRRLILRQRLERARVRLGDAEMEWLLASHLYAAPQVIARRFEHYQRALHCYEALFERCCAEAGIGVQHDV